MRVFFWGRGGGEMGTGVRNRARVVGVRQAGCVSGSGQRRTQHGAMHAARLQQHDTAQHSTAQHSTAQHSTAQHSTAQHSTAQHSTAQHSTAHHITAQHSTAQHSTAQSCRPPAPGASTSPVGSHLQLAGLLLQARRRDPAGPVVRVGRDHAFEPPPARGRAARGGGGGGGRGGGGGPARRVRGAQREKGWNTPTRSHPHHWGSGSLGCCAGPAGGQGRGSVTPSCKRHTARGTTRVRRHCTSHHTFLMSEISLLLLMAMPLRSVR
jgi:hypothetical protein